MQRLRAVAAGVLLVVLDFRVDGFDLLPDPVGWLLALVALWRLAELHHAFAVAAMVCVIGLVASVPGQVSEPAPTGWLPTVGAVCETVLVFAVCTGVRALVPTERRRADQLRWWDLGIAVALVGLLALAETVDEGFGVLALAVGLAGVVVLVMFLLMLRRAARAPDPSLTFGEVRPTS